MATLCTHHPSVLSWVLFTVDLDTPDLRLVVYAVLVSPVFPHCLQVPIIIRLLGIICIDFNEDVLL
jgi:hypothetical protein